MKPRSNGAPNKRTCLSADIRINHIGTNITVLNKIFISSGPSNDPGMIIFCTHKMKNATAVLPITTPNKVRVILRWRREIDIQVERMIEASQNGGTCNFAWIATPKKRAAPTPQIGDFD